MFQRSQTRRCYGKALYGPRSTLPSDFYRCCAEHFNIRIHEGTFIGVRSSQHRGLFLSADRAAPLRANTPLATIPLNSLYTVSNIATKPNTLRDVTVDNVRDAIRDDEFRIMAPQFYLGLQMSAIIASLPDITRSESQEEYERMSEILREGASPYARLLDDEDFSEEFVFGMYGMALDAWQRSSYEEMTKKYHLALTSIHEALRLPFKLEHFQRITRLVVARAEHVPPAGYYGGTTLMRKLSRRWRKWKRIPDPFDVALAPYLDLVNHSNRPNCAVRIGPSPVLNGAGAITLFSLRDIQPGQELCRHYNFGLNRASALFRYGFLPFDLISIVDHDAIDEHLIKNASMFKPESQEELEKRERERRELARLEKIFQDAKHSSSGGGHGAPVSGELAPNAAMGDRISRRQE
ncbi:hypothetical protein ABL78_2378 [Leptomonas seymouri]|uniref:SET domain-containing protein n=1 Tax=Leptomonas seymouri TaxID=5684 RepID=A0A0N1ILL6_LEPSE|nr:hypothetical protein ABL78_2378 [Leptomonas seymouri]|eukprot:KPI88482.1 hypothetical protein ABL78_2378 [Leptomonas seymouri]